MSLDVSVVIPCLNEEKTLPSIIERCQKSLRAKALNFEVVVVDNNSIDNSAQRAESAGAVVVSEPIKGYGAALHRGIQSARGRWVLMLDADGSYSPEDFETILNPLVQDQADFVLGNRLRAAHQNPQSMPWAHLYFGTPVLSRLHRSKHRLPVYDCNSGLRGFKRSVFVNWSPLSQGMEFASEMLIHVAQQKQRYLEVPISFKKDDRKGPSHLRPIRDGLRHLWLILMK